MADYPRQLRLFKAWAKAMEEGATVDSPHYRGTTTASRPKRQKRRTRRNRRFRLMRRRRKKEE